MRLWSVQKRLARLVARGGKVLVKACHNVGKTFLAACLTSWWFDTYPVDSCVITTAPTFDMVSGLLWRELRLLRNAAGLGGFVGDKAPQLFAREDHFAKGMTADKGTGFHGRHLEHMLFIFDEAVEIKSEFWTAVKSMYKTKSHHAWFVIANPTDTSSQMYQEEMNGDWEVVTMSAVDHPSVKLGLRGHDPVYRAGIDIDAFNGWVSDTSWCEPIQAIDAIATDFEWPPRSGIWYRPGPDFEARALGRWPSQATYNVWSDSAWHAAQHALTWGLRDLPEIGCDVARHGNDYTAIVVRWGPCAVHMERHNGWEGPQSVGRIKELAREYAAQATALRNPAAAPITPQEIRVKIDDDGCGATVADWGDGYNFEGIGAGTTAQDEDRYRNKRSELWFSTLHLAKQGRLDLTRIPLALKHRLRSELMAPTWDVNPKGQREVEEKKKTKKRLPQRGSPDLADALNLAFYETTDNLPIVIDSTPGRGNLDPTRDSAQRRRGMMGMR